MPSRRSRTWAPSARGRTAGSGCMVHDTMAFSPTGLPLGLLDVQCWARDAQAFGKKHTRKRLAHRGQGELQVAQERAGGRRAASALARHTVVSVGDREADIFELFDQARSLPHAPQAADPCRARPPARPRAGQALGAPASAAPSRAISTCSAAHAQVGAARVAKHGRSRYARGAAQGPQAQGQLKPVSCGRCWPARSMPRPTPTRWSGCC